MNRISDGTEVHLRLLRRDDRELLLGGFNKLSAESRYLRFFSAMPRLPERTLRQLLNVDGWNHVAIAAETVGHEPEGLGVARFMRQDDEDEVAEAAVAVVDHMQRRGLGKLLLSTLAAAARERGVTRFRTEVLRTNVGMNALLRELGDPARPTMDGPVAVYEIELPEAAAEVMTGPLFSFLRLAAEGLEILLRRLDPSSHVKNKKRS